ncbi:polysaccharide deacetylase family protein [Leucobacter sp. Z1108]|uniref:polysaccharide deacetylase family protein n=1 Tax=Leucobacter sp. W1038 TaxID=3438281 RepID=UPI003D97C77A
MQHRVSGGGAWPRRAFLISAVGGVATLAFGCAPEVNGSRPRSVTSPTPPASLSPETSADPLAEKPATTAPSPPAPPDLEAIIAAHEGQVPQHWGIDIPGVVRTGIEAGSAQPERVFLTLDACGGPHGSGVDERLIAGLREASVPATLFLNLRWIEAHAGLAASLAADPLFELANHGSDHLPLSVTGRSAYGISGTATVREAAHEVWQNHVALTELMGRVPRWFRPGTAHLDDVGLRIAEAMGERVLGFSVNGDAGATFPAATVASEVGAAGPGAIIIAHMNQPGSGTADGVRAAVDVVRARGLDFGLL